MARGLEVRVPAADGHSPGTLHVPVAAGGLGRKIAAAASLHGGRLAVADDPSSTP
jgi:hypothetical protein